MKLFAVFGYQLKALNGKNVRQSAKIEITTRRFADTGTQGVLVCSRTLFTTVAVVLGRRIGELAEGTEQPKLSEVSLRLRRYLRLPSQQHRCL